MEKYIECPNAWECGDKCEECEECGASCGMILEGCDGCCGVPYCRNKEEWMR